MKKISLLLMVLFSLAIFPSCGNCDSANCKNDGICMNGECECLVGFEGKFCEVITRDKLIGNYSLSSTCDDSGIPTEGWAIAASSSETYEILINNFHKPAFNIIATLNHDGVFDIYEQSISSQGIEYTFSGFASFDENGNINVDYKVITDSPATTANCVVQAMRQ